MNTEAPLTNGDWLRAGADAKGVPLRTLADVTADLAEAKPSGCDIILARMMLRVGRLTDEAREYVAREYPQK